MPITVIAGLDQTREPRPPLPISGIPSITVPSSRNCSSLCVVQRGDRVENGEQRIRGGAAVLAAVLSRLEGTDLERDIGDPAQRRGECRSPWGDAAHVTDDQRIGAEQIGIVERVAQQRAAPNLLVALDTELDRPEACLSTRAGRRGGRSRWTW